MNYFFLAAETKQVLFDVLTRFGAQQDCESYQTLLASLKVCPMARPNSHLLTTPVAQEYLCSLAGVKADDFGTELQLILFVLVGS